MQKIVIMLIFLVIVSNVSAMKINEIELNPAGADSGNEWVEFYCEVEVELNGWKLVNEDEGEIMLKGTCDGYYIYEFEKQWLDNKDAQLFLYYGGVLIDETEIFLDSANNEKTHQFCDAWEFKQETKAKKNDCGVEENSKNEEDEEEKRSNEEILENVEDFEEEGEVKPIKNTPTLIRLNAQTIKSEDDTEKIDKSYYAKYGFVIFCILLGILFLFRKKQINKNEFD